MKKLLTFRAVFVVASLVVAAAAFANGTSESTTQQKPVVVTYKSYTGPITGNDKYYQTALGAYILKKFNIQLQIWPTSESTYRQSLVRDAATNSFPDMLTVWIYPNTPDELLVLQKAAREGLLAPLGPSVNKYAPLVKKALSTPQNWPAYTQEYMSDPTLKGKTYFLPCWYDLQNYQPPGWAFVIRDDIKKKLGLTTPIFFKNTSQFIDLLQKIKAMDPVDINGNQAWAMGGITYWQPLLATITRPFDFGGATTIGIDSSGKLNEFVMTDWAWKQILFVRQLLSDGLMDPQTLTQTFAKGREVVAQGRYIVEPFFAGGGINYHKPTVAKDPNMSYSVLGNFYTHLGPNGPLLVENLGMETHFLNAFSSKANMDAIMPFVEWLQTTDGVASNYYGVKGVQWNWDSTGKNAVLDPKYKESFLSSAVPNPFSASVGTGMFNFFTTILGKNAPNTRVFDGTNAPTYPLDPTFTDQVNERTAIAYDNGKGIEQKNGIAIANFINSYPEKDQIQPLLSNINKDLMFPAYLASSQAAAKKLLDDYRATLKREGIDKYLSYLQGIYDKNPGKYVVYVSEGS